MFLILIHKIYITRTLPIIETVYPHRTDTHTLALCNSIRATLDQLLREPKIINFTSVIAWNTTIMK